MTNLATLNPTVDAEIVDRSEGEDAIAPLAQESVESECYFSSDDEIISDCLLDAQGDKAMNKLHCPHCGKTGISILRKMCLGPAIPAKCKVCGKKVGVPYTSMLAGIPFFAAIFASALIEPFVFKAALWVGGFVIYSFIHMRWIPLEPR